MNFSSYFLFRFLLFIFSPLPIPHPLPSSPSLPQLCFFFPFFYLIPKLSSSLHLLLSFSLLLSPFPQSITCPKSTSPLPVHYPITFFSPSIFTSPHFPLTFPPHNLTFPPLSSSILFLRPLLSFIPPLTRPLHSLTFPPSLLPSLPLPQPIPHSFSLRQMEAHFFTVSFGEGKKY